MKKLSLLVIILIFTVITVSAQRKKDVLYLKNGSIIYGKLMEANDNQYTIKTPDGSILIYAYNRLEIKFGFRF